MHDEDKSLVMELVECEVCLKEIPASAAKMEEAADYVHHFCGLICYAKWKDQVAEEQAEQKA